MQPSSPISVILAGFVLLGLAVAHGHDDNGDMTMGMAMAGPSNTRPTIPPAASTTLAADPSSYFQYGEHSTLLLAHILVMTVGWVFVLPVGQYLEAALFSLLIIGLLISPGVMLSIARSRYSLPVQFLFLALNTVGILLATVYNARTPDLYPNNAHHKLGWVVTWVVGAQIVLGVISAYKGRRDGKREERAAFIPVSMEAMEEHQRKHGETHRFSNDSGQGTEPNTESLRSQSISSRSEHDLPSEYREHEEDYDEVEKHGLMHGSKVDTFLSKRIPGLLSSRVLRVFHFFYDAIDRVILLLGFMALATGIITYGGLFVSQNLVALVNVCLMTNRWAGRSSAGSPIGSRVESSSGTEF